jgi:hypothetical protein
VVAGKLRRIGRGLYDFPRHSEILKGDVSANLDATVQAISRQDKVRVMPNGIVFANNMRYLLKRLTSAAAGLKLCRWVVAVFI